MWSLDWFSAREIARGGGSIRRVAWARGTWLVWRPGVWWVRLADLSWRVALAGDFAEADFRARDWTNEGYKADVCGGLPAYNTAPPTDGAWGDTPEMRPRPVPNFPEEAA